MERRFPLLDLDAYELTSDESSEYNCAAWAVGIDTARWWPDPDLVDEYYWAPGARRDETLQAFVEGYGVLGFEVCDTPDFEAGFEKIAVYARSQGTPRHVAVQRSEHRWASKLGWDGEDIEHPTVRDLVVPYGEPQLFMRRRRS